MFRSSESSLAQILQGGSQTISGIMDKAIQIGRDMSNNQRSQEQDLFGMRRNETALQQRRAENLQQNNEDAQRFARNAFEFDTKFDAQQEQQGFENTRATANDLFSQGMQQKNYGLSVAAGNRAERSLTDQELGRKQAQDKIDNERRGIESLFAPSEVSAKDSNVRLGEIDTALGSRTITPQDEARLRGERNSIMGSIEASKKTEKVMTPEQEAAAKRAAQDQQFQVQDRQKNQTEDAVKPLLVDVDAFPLQATDTGKSTDQQYIDKTKAADTAWNSNRLIAEPEAARNYTDAEQFANVVPGLSEAKKEKRRKLWRLVNAQPVQQADSAPVSPVQSDLDKLLSP